MRNLILTPTFEDFYKAADPRLINKIDYALTILEQFEIPSAKFVKKLQGSVFYELRISVDNEYRSFYSLWIQPILSKRKKFLFCRAS